MRLWEIGAPFCIPLRLGGCYSQFIADSGDTDNRLPSGTSTRSATVMQKQMRMGVFRHYIPSFSSTIFSTLKIVVELANAVSASYAIASNGLCR